MTSRSDFTPEEWKTLQIGLIGAGMAVSVSDGGLFSVFKEAAAMSRTLQSDAAQGGLVGEIADMKDERPSKEDMGGRNVAATVLASLESACQILTAKAPDQLPVYQMAVAEVAHATAAASKGVQPAEAATIASIRRAVGLSDQEATEAGDPSI